MLRQFLVGGGVSLVTIAIHAVVMTSIVRQARDIGTTKAIDPRLHPSWLLTAVMVPIVSVLMIVHFLEVSVWALTYLFVDATPLGHDVLYFAFVNYTTLGYGDITSVAVAALAEQFSRKRARATSAATIKAYRTHMRALSKLSPIEIWHSKIELTREVKKITDRRLRQKLHAILATVDETVSVSPRAAQATPLDLESQGICPSIASQPKGLPAID